MDDQLTIPEHKPAAVTKPLLKKMQIVDQPYITNVLSYAVEIEFTRKREHIQGVTMNMNADATDRGFGLFRSQEQSTVDNQFTIPEHKPAAVTKALLRKMQIVDRPYITNARSYAVEIEFTRKV